MKKHPEVHRIRKGEKMPLRIYISSAAVSKLGKSCLISCAFVLIAVLIFGKGKLHWGIVLFMGMLVCFLTAFIGGHMLVIDSRKLTVPIEQVSQAAEQIASGNLDAVIRTDTEIEEFDTLVTGFNQMAAALRKMEYMNREFVNNVSHEFKTPISAIAGFSEILQEQGLSDEEKNEYLSLIHEEAVRLSHLTENVLRISKLDTQEIVAHKEAVNISEQIRRCVIILNEKWNEKNRFEIAVPDLIIRSNSEMTQEIWMNLIDNAVKYSEKGTEIVISGNQAENEIMISVKDNGCGIPAEKLPRIFDSFYQCDESRNTEGNGLGLAIVKRIVTLLGGTVECISTEGKGTEMKIRLPKNF